MLALTKFGQSPILSLDFQLGGVKDTPVLPTGKEKENKKWKVIRRCDQHGVKRQVEKTAVPVPEDGWGRQAEAEFAQVSRYPGTAATLGGELLQGLTWSGTPGPGWCRLSSWG